MRHVLSPDHRDVLRRVAGRDALLAFDFDGTLAPIVDQPAAAAMRPDTRALLAALARRRAVAIITGRSVADVRPRLHGVRTVAVIGNHGIEPSVGMADARAAISRLAPRLAARVGGEPGVQVEEKGHSIAVHYRHAPSPARVRRAVDEVLAESGEPVRRIEGIAALNLVPAGAPTKGDAIRQLQALHRAPAVLYVGDEATDEDAFAVLDPDCSLGVRVGAHTPSHAPWFVAHQGEVDELLRALLAHVVPKAAPRPGARLDRGGGRGPGTLAGSPAPQTE